MQSFWVMESMLFNRTWESDTQEADPAQSLAKVFAAAAESSHNPAAQSCRYAEMEEVVTRGVTVEEVQDCWTGGCFVGFQLYQRCV